MRLFIRQRFFSWTDSFDITDEEGYAVYSVRADLLEMCIRDSSQTRA